MPNMALHISSHNKNIMQEFKKAKHPDPKTRDCEVAEKCSLNGNCKQSAVIYQADVTTEINDERIYIGLIEGSFNERLSNHRTSSSLHLSMNNTKINPNYLLLSGKRKIMDRISKEVLHIRLEAKNVICLSGKSLIS